MHSDSPTSLKDWIGRTHEAEDIVTPRLLDSFRAMLAPHVAETDPVVAPVGLHWCLAPDIVDGHKLGQDGHPARGGFLPPVQLPRRMWASSEVRFLAPLLNGDKVHRRSTISAVDEKQGRSGHLVFVTVRHEFSSRACPVVEEAQTIVYRGAETGTTYSQQLGEATPEMPHKRSVEINAVLLFRYSALTFNAHRIHYDVPYVTTTERYPGLVIHGPLQATFLMNFAASIKGRPPRSFSFRGVQAATGPQTLTLRAGPGDGETLALEVRSATGHVTMKAMATW